MMDVFWLQQNQADVSPQDHWLSETETALLDEMRFLKRRADWRLGRWTAKNALAARLNLPARAFSSLEIRPAKSGAPQAYFLDKLCPVSISLSHRDGKAVCVLADARAALGCDLELIEPHSDNFVADYFTREEQGLISRAAGPDREELITLLWSAKESTLKALGTGLRLDTRSVVVEPCFSNSQAGNSHHSWQPLRVRYGDLQMFPGWWRRVGDCLSTIVSIPAGAAPTLLNPTPIIRRAG